MAGFSITYFSFLARSGGLASRNHSIATWSRFPWRPDCHSGGLGLRFFFDTPLPLPCDLALLGHFSGFALTHLTSLARSGGLAIRNHSIATRNRFPWCPDCHSGGLGLRFFSTPLPLPCDLGPYYYRHFSGFALTHFTSLARSGGLAIRNISIATRKCFPRPPGRHSGGLGLRFFFDSPLLTL